MKKGKCPGPISESESKLVCLYMFRGKKLQEILAPEESRVQYGLFILQMGKKETWKEETDLPKGVLRICLGDGTVDAEAI